MLAVVDEQVCRMLNLATATLTTLHSHHVVEFIGVQRLYWNSCLAKDSRKEAQEANVMNP